MDNRFDQVAIPRVGDGAHARMRIIKLRGIVAFILAFCQAKSAMSGSQPLPWLVPPRVGSAVSFTKSVVLRRSRLVQIRTNFTGFRYSLEERSPLGRSVGKLAFNVQNSDSNGLNGCHRAESERNIPGSTLIICDPREASNSVLQCEILRFQKKIVTLRGPDV